MVSANRLNRHDLSSATRSESSWWRPRFFVSVVLFLGIAGFLSASYVALSARFGLRQSPEEPAHAVSAQAPAVPKAPAGSSSPLSLGSAAPAPGPREPTTPGLAQAAMRRPTSAAYLSRRSPERVHGLHDVNLGGWITGADAAGVSHVLQDLRDQGSGAVPAIREFLERMEDIEFGEASGDGDLLASGSLRLALFDIIGEIGGSEAIDVVMAQLGMTGDPLEIAILAQKLEALAPGAYQPELLKAASEALQWIALAPPRERPDVAPLFELLQAYGGPEVVRDMAPGTGDWWEYSLMALAGLSEGEGIPVLIAEAYNPTVPLEHKSQFPVQMLAQAATQYSEAGDALVDLARSGGIPDSAWEAIGGTLAGEHLQFPLQLFEGTEFEGFEGTALEGFEGTEFEGFEGTEFEDFEGTEFEGFEGTALEGDQAGGSGVEAPDLLRNYYIESLNMTYEQHLVAANWSDEQIDQQLALIDKLRNATSSPDALSALEEAEQSLLGDG